MSLPRRNLELSLLRTFVALADVGTVTGVAERLAYTQSAVSMQLRRLESVVGVELVRREGRNLVLTQGGQRLLRYARRMLALNDEAWADVRGGPSTGVIRVGIPDDYAPLLSPTLAYFHEVYPAVELEVHCDLSVELVRRVRAGELDIAIATRQRNSPGGEVLRREPLVWAASRAREPPLEDPIALALSAAAEDVFRELALGRLEAAGRSWRTACTGQSMTGIRPALDAGLAVAVVARSMVTPDLRVLDESSDLPALPSVEISLHRPPGRPSEPARWLAGLVQDQWREA
ncbi:MAG: LysR substrate-binding domain-containing protein [Halofilum sp. (in: g-proteobacteria)]|nr:LysR substrate-binding domain-containing protein [Halofilum sp. (in: g-proteobacteria)]